MGNGTVEKLNHTLGNIIHALAPKAKHRWPQMVKSLTFWHNATIHETTTYPPFQLIFSRTPVSCLHDVWLCLITRWSIMTSNCSLSEMTLYRLWNWPEFIRVLLANKGKRGRRKTADRWKGNIYIVTVNSDMHTFKIRNCVTGAEKIVHRNLIVPVYFLPPQNEVTEVNNCENIENDDQSINESCERTVA